MKGKLWRRGLLQNKDFITDNCVGLLSLSLYSLLYLKPSHAWLLQCKTECLYESRLNTPSVRHMAPGRLWKKQPCCMKSTPPPPPPPPRLLFSSEEVVLCFPVSFPSYRQPKQSDAINHTLTDVVLLLFPSWQTLPDVCLIAQIHRLTPPSSSSEESLGEVHCYRAVRSLIYEQQVHTVCSA